MLIAAGILAGNAVAASPRPPAEMMRIALSLDARARDHIGLGKNDEAVAELDSARAILREANSDARAVPARPQIAQAIAADRMAIMRLQSRTSAATALSFIHAADLAERRALARLTR